MLVVFVGMPGSSIAGTIDNIDSKVLGVEYVTGLSSDIVHEADLIIIADSAPHDFRIEVVCIETLTLENYSIESLELSFEATLYENLYRKGKGEKVLPDRVSYGNNIKSKAVRPTMVKGCDYPRLPG